MRLISTFCLILALVLAGTAHAHIGEKVYLIFEIPDADLGDIDLFTLCERGSTALAEGVFMQKAVYINSLREVAMTKKPRATADF